MHTMSQLLAEIGPFHWLAISAVLIGVEMILPTQYLMWPGISAGVVGLLGFVVDLPLVVEIGLFAAFSAALVVAAHFYFPGAVGNASWLLNKRMDQLVGKVAIVREDFVHGQGAVTLGDSRWAAQSEDGSDLPSGTKVVVLSTESTLLKVKRFTDPRQ